jgi:hypothetical protein
MITPIDQHEGKKYLRTIYSALRDGCSVRADVYEVIEAFHRGLDLPEGVAHALKKLLCPGNRGKGSVLADLEGAVAALNRAVEILRRREAHEKKMAEELLKAISNPLPPQAVRNFVSGQLPDFSDRHYQE